MARPKILFIDDSKDLLQMVCEALEKDYEMHAATDAETGLVMLREVAFDLVIVDLGLPTMNGYKLCATIRAQEKSARIPIIIYSGSLEIEDKLMGFSIGANDYFTKPGDLRELKARIQIQLKEAHKEVEKKHHIDMDPFQLNLNTQSIYYWENGSKKILNLSSLEFRLLHFFLTHVDHVVTREQLLDQVWGSLNHVNDRSVDAVISKLRYKLDSYAGLIQSVHGVGYRFLNPRAMVQEKNNLKKAS